MSLQWYRSVLSVAGAAALLSLGACTYTGGVGEPVGRSFTWISYAAGDDIKARCTPGAPAQYRLVYNANWQEQVRAYDLRRSVIVGGGAILRTQVFGGGGNVANFDIGDVQSPWRGKGGDVSLTEDQYLQLIRAVEASGFGEPAPAGERLDSWDFYWLASACAGGQFHFNAWRYPSDRFARVTFDKLLFALDGTGVPPNPLRKVDRAEEYFKSTRPGVTYSKFQLMVGHDGLAGRLPPM